MAHSSKSGGTRTLVDQECGQQNALVHYKDQLLSDPRVRLLPSSSRLHDQFSNEYLGAIAARQAAPATFSMGELMRQLPQTQGPVGTQPRHADWTREYVAATAAIRPEIQWQQEFLNGRGATTDKFAMMDGAWIEAAGTNRTANYHSSVSRWFSLWFVILIT